MQSTLPSTEPAGLHVAIIMDGNGRWATGRGLPRVRGHCAGAEAVRRVVEAAPGLGIGVLTLFAFSSDNWHRPAGEVAGLMRLLRHYLQTETARCVANGIRLSVIGRRDRLPGPVRMAIEAARAATAGGERMHLRLAVDYSARDVIFRAARRLGAAESAQREDFARFLAEAMHAGESAPDVDLLIRTSGEQRLSDFLLWECAYAELYFTERPWPDFDADDLAAAIREFQTRNRRFGRAPEAAAG